MTYIEIWRDRIAKGEATGQEAFNWLVCRGVYVHIAMKVKNYARV
mgnify:FL=1